MIFFLLLLPQGNCECSLFKEGCQSVKIHVQNLYRHKDREALQGQEQT